MPCHVDSEARQQPGRPVKSSHELFSHLTECVYAALPHDLADLYEYGVIAGITESSAMHQPEPDQGFRLV
jgi:hypothetical protein